jgi:hypothetical protein
VEFSKMDEDAPYDIDQFHRTQLQLMERLAAVFVAQGYELPSGFQLLSLVNLNHFINPSLLTQDTGNVKNNRLSTRVPLEKLIKALDAVVECFREIEDTASFESPPGRLNVCDVFLEMNDGFDPLQLNSAIIWLGENARFALQVGKVPEKKEPNFAYDEFIDLVLNTCGNKPPESRARLVSLISDCEFILPLAYRAKTKAAIGDRVDARIKRLKEAKASPVDRGDAALDAHGEKPSTYEVIE